jgi:glutaredoxin
MDHPLLFFSTFCNYCEQFVAALDNNGLSDVFKYINIDVDPETGARPPVFYDIQSKLQINITEVPTIILNGGEYVLAGEDAFKWLQFQLENTNNVGPSEPKELDAYNPMEMGSFSDMYASVHSDSLHDAKNQSFKFLNAADERIMTPVEEKLQKQSQSQSQSIPPKRNAPTNPPAPQFKHAPKPTALDMLHKAHQKITTAVLTHVFNNFWQSVRQLSLLLHTEINL